MPARARVTDLFTDERRLIESMRVVLAIIAAQLMLDTQAASHTYLFAGIAGFSVYAGVLLWFSASGRVLPVLRILPWLDCCWFLLLIALAGPGGFHYFLFLFFPVLFASWQRGVGESTAVAIFSSSAALIILCLRAPGISWPTLLALPLSLLVTGSLVAVLARAEADSRRAYAFSTHLVERLDPRRGFDAIMPKLLEPICHEFDAQSALLLMRDVEGGEHALCWEEGEGCSRLSEASAESLLACVTSLSEEHAFLHRRRTHLFGRSSTHHEPMPGSDELPGMPEPVVFEQLARLLEQDCLMITPVRCRSVGNMTLILGSASGHLRTHGLEVLMRVTEQIAPLIDNALLLERLSTEAVENERAKIGRTLHDSAIQPYIGLKFAVEALVRKAGPDNPLSEDLQRMLAMASTELAAMRDVVSGLRGSSGQGGELLASAVQRQALRFGQLFGIEVSVDIQGTLPVDRHIADELFHLVAEGLSNIRRHTRAHMAWIALRCEEGVLELRIRNEHGNQPPLPTFTPRSISERAALLGGETRVDIDPRGCSITVTIPLN
ncbi:histidine kinase [Uliginosibacterium sp. 31-16]|uniref:sensor histidine kinase n=1 Tax=Uliginosibacterium sp. 31-16 TaxID=3068315 RepID=UPI00273F51D9|nr:histidine kinase [Uliginosibacterium sp. 31-16]MDP5238047.1 histidine kinase [Uliginosibacterium sp. 31-16]